MGIWGAPTWSPGLSTSYPHHIDRLGVRAQEGTLETTWRVVLALATLVLASGTHVRGPERIYPSLVGRDRLLGALPKPRVAG